VMEGSRVKFLDFQSCRLHAPEFPWSLVNIFAPKNGFGTVAKLQQQNSKRLMLTL